MFDDLKKNDANAFEASRKTVEDMFAETEADNTPPAPLRQPVTPAPRPFSEKHEAFQPKQPQNAASDPVEEKEEEAKYNMKKVLMISSFAIALLAIVGGSWYAYAKFFKKDSEVKTIVENPDNANKEEPNQNNGNQNTNTDQNNANNQPANQNPDNNNTQPDTQPANPPDNTPNLTTDTDGDGLTDEEEKQLGTNSALTDTDNDGLFDRQEVKVYKTDPKNSDSDGDGYSDGDEVKSDYNPLGAGKLLPPLPQ